jgi:hypothetical protein
MYERAATEASPGGAARQDFPAIHSSLPSHSSVQSAILEWTNGALPNAALAAPPYFNEALLGLEWATLFFLAALFVPLSELAGWVLARQPFGEMVPETELSFWSSSYLGGYGLAAGAAAVSAIALLDWKGLSHPLSFLHLADGDYLASVLLFATLWLLPLILRRPWVRSWRQVGIRAGVALALATYLLALGGGFLTWQLYDFWPTPVRFAKALLLMLVLFPYALGEELLVRTGSSRMGGTPRGAFVIWRLGLLAALLYGAGALGSGAGMLLLMALPLVLLSLVQYFFAAALRRSLGSVYACAVFNAVLLGWFIATVFPLR